MQVHLSLQIKENLAIWIQELISTHYCLSLCNMIDCFYEERISFSHHHDWDKKQ